jgi:hypothetical protein
MLFSPEAFQVDQEIERRWREKQKADNRRSVEEYEHSSFLWWRQFPHPPPFPEKIAKHVARYGDEGVEEILRAYGASEKSPTSLRAQGFSVEEIARTLNTTAKRVRLALSA